MNNLAASAPVDICIGKRISRRPWDSCCCLPDHFVYLLFVDIENMVSSKLFVTIRARTGVHAIHRFIQIWIKCTGSIGSKRTRHVPSTSCAVCTDSGGGSRVVDVQSLYASDVSPLA